MRPPLLAMLGDADSEVQGRALAFWDSALPRTLSARLAALLSDSLEEASTWVSALLLATLHIEQGVSSLRSYLSLLSGVLPKCRPYIIWATLQRLTCSMPASCPAQFSFGARLHALLFSIFGINQHMLKNGDDGNALVYYSPKLRIIQKERLEELWPRGASRLLLRLSADEPGYDSPIFDTGQAYCMHCAMQKPPAARLFGPSAMYVCQLCWAPPWIVAACRLLVERLYGRYVQAELKCRAGGV